MQSGAAEEFEKCADIIILLQIVISNECRRGEEYIGFTLSSCYRAKRQTRLQNADSSVILPNQCESSSWMRDELLADPESWRKIKMVRQAGISPAAGKHS